jgi:hypothetical protein
MSHYAECGDLCIVMLNVILLSVVMLNIVAPSRGVIYVQNILSVYSTGHRS